MNRNRKKVGGKKCWSGYTAKGTKKSASGRRVNNCVKKLRKYRLRRNTLTELPIEQMVRL